MFQFDGAVLWNPELEMKHHGKRLLIVEDDLPLRRMLTWEFEDLGYRVYASACCAEAIAAVKTRTFDLALLDYNLPDGTGLDLLTLIRRQNPELPVILCSGMVSESNLRQARLFEKVSFVSKPITADNLHERFLLLDRDEQ